MQAVLLPRTWDVCGIIVPPLSIWHVYILQTTGNSYLCGGDLTLDSAAEVLMYASLDVKDGRKLYTQPFFRQRHRNKILKALNKIESVEIYNAMTEYISECVRTPSHKEVKSSDSGVKSEPVAAPTAWILAEYLSGGVASKLDEAFNTPFSIACCMFDAKRNVAGEDDSLNSEIKEERIDKKVELMNEEKEKAA